MEISPGSPGGLARPRNEGIQMAATRPVRRRRLASASFGAFLAIASTLAVAAPASAELSFEGFITHGDAGAGWVNEPDAPPGSTDQDSVELLVRGTSMTDLDDAARAILTGIASTPPAIAPSFDFKVSNIGASGGSVRLAIKFSNGGIAELRPLSLQADQWTHVDGSGSDWDTRGGSCGSLTQRTYTEVLACHPGASVSGVEVLSDSGWLYPGLLRVLVDNISYGGETISAQPPAVQGESIDLTTVAGQVVVRLPEKIGVGEGASDLARISAGTTVPVGAVVDARIGRARLASSQGGGATQAAVFREGRFRVTQSRRPGGVTKLSLRGRLSDCPGRGARASGAAPQAQASLLRRRLWGRGTGRFRTRGSYSSGSVRGTHWLTEDRCNGTLTRVRSGVVEVRDFVRHVTVRVRAGQSYFARAPR